MSSKAVTLTVRPRGKPVKKLPEEVLVTSTGSTYELHKEIAQKAGISIDRLRITKGSDGSLVPNKHSFTVYDTGLREQSTIYVKDIGPQIAWRTTFILEYLGPILIHPILYFLLPGTSGASELQTYTFALVMFHFLKREFETVYIHRFSAATMPLRNVFTNSAHYWILGGVNLAYWNYRPASPATLPSNPYITYPALALFIIGEAGNLYTHIILRNLRSSGGTERGIPEGWGFGLVTCPNYMFEVVAWLGVALLTWSWSSVLFLAAGLLPMASWGKKKEAKYRKEFGNRYQRKRFVMLPGIW